MSWTFLFHERRNWYEIHNLNENMKKLFILTFSVLFITSCANSDHDDDDPYSSPSSWNNSDTSNISDNANMFTVTVSYGKYYLDGINTKSINLKKGNTYYFDLSQIFSHT